MENKKKIVFLCSGNGGNLIFLFNSIGLGWLEGYEIAAVLTDRDCRAGSLAKSLDINTYSLNFSEIEQSTLMQALLDIKPDIIITNVHRLIHSSIVDLFFGKIINLHYSLLPAFAGLIGSAAPKAAIESYSKFTGITLHYVDKVLDGGNPIIQIAIPLEGDEIALDNIMDTVFKAGCISLLSYFQLKDIEQKNDSKLILINNQKCLQSGGYIDLPEELKDIAFWSSIKSMIEKN
jgi:phosphoribosylglycinamide formyltransferase-1